MPQIDLLAPDAAAATAAALRAAVPWAEVLPSAYCRVPLRSFLHVVRSVYYYYATILLYYYTTSTTSILL